jgi:hypothetical protein
MKMSISQLDKLIESKLSSLLKEAETKFDSELKRLKAHKMSDEEAYKFLTNYKNYSNLAYHGDEYKFGAGGIEAYLAKLGYKAPASMALDMKDMYGDYGFLNTLSHLLYGGANEGAKKFYKNIESEIIKKIQSLDKKYFDKAAEYLTVDDGGDKKLLNILFTQMAKVGVDPKNVSDRGEYEQFLKKYKK